MIFGKKDVNVFCMAVEKPETWANDWNLYDNVYWGEQWKYNDAYKPESVVNKIDYNIDFNYDDSVNYLTVWTDFEIEKRIAPLNSESDRNYSETAENRRAVPLTDAIYPNPNYYWSDKISGMFYLAVDKDGYLVYAGYGTGAGYSSPSDNYYHNQKAGKDWQNAEYFAINKNFKLWSENSKEITLNDTRVINDYSAFDLIVPEGGFVIKGFYDEANMVALAKQLMPNSNYIREDTTKLPVNYVSTASGGVTLFADQEVGSLDKYYLSINSKHQLSVRERTPSEMKDENGNQKIKTPAKNFTPTANDSVKKYTTVKEANVLENETTVVDLKGVISYKNATSAIIVDTFKNAILIEDEKVEDLVCGETINIDGTKVTKDGSPMIINITKIEKITEYGKQKEIEPLKLNDDNYSTLWTIENNYKYFEITKATVVAKEQDKLSIQDSKGNIILINKNLDLFNLDLEDVKANDFIDATFYMYNQNGVLNAMVDSNCKLIKYYSLEVDIDGDKGVLEPTINYYKPGESIELTAEIPGDYYYFENWLIYNDELETWEDYDNNIDIRVVIERKNIKLKAFFTYQPWQGLPEYMSKSSELTPLKVDDGDSTLSISTKKDIVFHAEKSWDKGTFNTSSRYIVIIDKDGKIAYMVDMPGASYGNPAGKEYYAHPDYSDYAKNPAFKLGEGYPEDGADFSLVVPEGGFIITSHSSDANDLVNAITEGVIKTITGEDCQKINQKTAPVSRETRLYYDEFNKKIVVYVSSLLEQHYVVTLNEAGNLSKAGIGVFTDTDDNPNVSKYDFAADRHAFTNDYGKSNMVIALDKDGKIIYASIGLGMGYASPADRFYTATNGKDAEGNPIPVVPTSDSTNKGTIVGDFFALGPNFASWSEWDAAKDNPNRDAELKYGDYETLVPTGGMVITGASTNLNMKYLWGQVFGRSLQTKENDAFANATTIGQFDNVKIELEVHNGVSQIKVTNPTSLWVDPITSSTESILSMEGYEIAPYGTDATDLYSAITIDSNTQLTVKATKTPDKVYVLGGDIDTIYGCSTAATSNGYTITAQDFDKTYYVVQEWTVEDKKYKSIAFHREGKDTFNSNDNLAEQVGAKFRLGGAKPQDVQWDGVRGSYFVSGVSLGLWNSVEFYYTATADGAETKLTIANCTLQGNLKKDAYSSNDRRLYDPTEGGNEGTFFCGVANMAPYSFEYLPESNTLIAY